MAKGRAPLISVIIPAYNEEKYVGDCVNALRSQTLPREEYEIIVVNARSKDRTFEVAKKLADKAIMEKRNSIGGARLDGVEASRGKIIATTDADTTPPHNWLALIKENLTSGKWEACYGPQKPRTRHWSIKSFYWLMNITAKLSHYLLGRPYMSGGNSAFTREIYEKAGRHSEISLCEDIDLGWRIKRAGGRMKFDSRMMMNVSQRRFRKHGFLQTVIEWKRAELALMLKRKPSETYASQTFDKYK